MPKEPKYPCLSCGKPVPKSRRDKFVNEFKQQLPEGEHCSNGPYGGLVRVWSGHQLENGVNITITEHQFGPSIVLVMLGEHVICEFDVPIPQLKLSFANHDKAKRAHDYLEEWLKEHCMYALIVLNRDGPAVVTVDRAHEGIHSQIRNVLNIAGMGFTEIGPPVQVAVL